MGEGKRKNLALRDRVLRQDPHCIYCGAVATTVDHMPPIQMFPGRDRPSGMEFGCCEACNSGTKGAEAVATIISRIGEDQIVSESEQKDLLRAAFAVYKNAPEATSKLFQGAQYVYKKNLRGIFEPMLRVNVESPVIVDLLDIFSAKMGLAIFRDLIGVPLPEGGAITSSWMLNRDAFVNAYQNLKGILDGVNLLKQGRKDSSNNFLYLYNTDGQNIVASLTAINKNLSIYNVVATKEFYERNIVKLPDLGSISTIRKGELIGHKRDASGYRLNALSER